MRCSSRRVGPVVRPHRPPGRSHYQTRSDGPNAARGTREKVVVLGSGWAGFRIAKDVSKPLYVLGEALHAYHSQFTPLLPETTVGTLEFRTIMEPVRSIPDLTFYQSACKAINPEKKTITCYGAYSLSPQHEQYFDLPYDRLIIAVGAHNQTFGIPGVAENAFFLKEVDQARRVRLKILECFERASEPFSTPADRKKMLTFVVVGGGATGIEFAAELTDFIKEDITRRYPREVSELASVIVLEAGSSILSAFDQSLSGYAEKQLRKRRVDVRLGSKVKGVLPNEIEMHDGTKIPFGVIAPRPLVRALPWEKSKDGRLIVDRYLRVANHSNIYALGDCSFLPDRPLPCTAQAADQQAKYLSKALNREAHNQEVQQALSLEIKDLTTLQPTSFVYVHRGMLAYVGSYKAISDLPHHKWRGLFAWLFWRSAYLSTLVSWSNRILVPMHWFKAFLFGRDVSYF